MILEYFELKGFLDVFQAKSTVIVSSIHLQTFKNPFNFSFFENVCFSF